MRKQTAPPLEKLAAYKSAYDMVLPTLSLDQLRQVERLMLDAITHLPVGSQRALNMHSALARVRARIGLVETTPAAP